MEFRRVLGQGEKFNHYSNGRQFEFGVSVAVRVQYSFGPIPGRRSMEIIQLLDAPPNVMHLDQA